MVEISRALGGYRDRASGRRQGIEVIDKISNEIVITQNSEAELAAFLIRHVMIEDFGKHTGQKRQRLIELLQENPRCLDPLATWQEEVGHFKHFSGRPIFIAASAWDFNSSLVHNRSGFSDEKTFDPVLTKEIEQQQERLGHFVIATALATEQMLYHMAKEKGIAPKTFPACENGKAWAIPIQEDGKTVFVEYRQPLNPEQKKALDSVKEICRKLAGLLRKNGLIAFVNEQKFSKCTIECAANGRDWYEKTIKELILPFLKKNGADWDETNTTFFMNGEKFSISPTPDTWEIDRVEGTDIIGKRVIREILYNTLSTLIHDKVRDARFKLLTGGDSVRFRGSDFGLTDNGPATVGFLVPDRERDPKESLEAAEEAMRSGRRFWLSYKTGENGATIAGPGSAPAFFMESVRKILPYANIPTEVFRAALVERLTGSEGLKEYRKYDIESPPDLYVFPQDMTGAQREKFLNSKPDILPADQQSVLANLKREAGV